MAMKILTKMLKQKAVVWASPTPDGYGKYTYGTSKEIDVRWQEKGELFMDVEGNEKLSDATVFTSEDVEIGSILYEGELSDLSAAQKADPESVGKKVRSFEKIPTIDCTQFLRKALL